MDRLASEPLCFYFICLCTERESWDIWTCHMLTCVGAHDDISVCVCDCSSSVLLMLGLKYVNNAHLSLAHASNQTK